MKKIADSIPRAILIGRHNDWRARYAFGLMATDFLVLVWVIFGVQIAWFGVTMSEVTLDDRPGEAVVSYSAISLVLIVSWMALLQIFGSRSYRVLGTGAHEYKLVTDSSVRLFGLVAILAFLLKIDFARGYILIAFPLGILVLNFSRWMWRQWLGVMRTRGEYSSRVLLVGSETSTTHLMQELARLPMAGYLVVGVCIPNGNATGCVPGTSIPLFDDIDKLTDAMDSSSADTVVVTSSEELSPARIRSISWSLEPGRHHMVVAPSLMDIGGPRIHTRPVAGLPLIHIETPRYEGGKKVGKRLFDLIGSASLLVVLFPVLITLAIVVKMTSQGPVLYRQERVGLSGQAFEMLKFRSMVVDADVDLTNLLQAQGTADRPLFKVKNDPRLTRVGAVLRKFSLDELPQILNVVRGEMSLVGPRPQRDGEVALYSDAARRRLMVQPGMTGLWQVSGRSALSWDDAIRLDLFYVENWSVTGDLVILFRTIRAVIFPGKTAY